MCNDDDETNRDEAKNVARNENFLINSLVLCTCCHVLIVSNGWPNSMPQALILCCTGKRICPKPPKTHAEEKPEEEDEKEKSVGC